jgi:diguanylate cyclase
VMGVLDRMAHEDGLTGITNRRGLDDGLTIELARARRSGVAVTVVMMDLDHFKRYNDRRGHAAGDLLLRGAAQAWRQQLRPTDLLARYGGEEFTLVLPSCDASAACLLVERLRPPVPDRQTFSAGVATWDGHESPEQLLGRADRALLVAKKQGRNRTIVSGQEPQMHLPLAMV